MIVKEKRILIRGQEKKDKRRGVYYVGEESKYRQGVAGREEGKILERKGKQRELTRERKRDREAKAT